MGYQTALGLGLCTNPNFASLRSPERFITFDEAPCLTDSGISQDSGIEPIEGRTRYFALPPDVDDLDCPSQQLKGTDRKVPPVGLGL